MRLPNSDTIGCFNADMDYQPLRQMLRSPRHQLKQNKVFDGSHWVGTGLNGVGRSQEKRCEWCRPEHILKVEVVVR